MTVEELIEELHGQHPAHEVVIADGIGGWMTPSTLNGDEDRVIMRLEPMI